MVASRYNPSTEEAEAGRSMGAHWLVGSVKQVSSGLVRDHVSKTRERMVEEDINHQPLAIPQPFLRETYT